jgi:glycosyltransferase involved in cell wall biosynthesis
MAGARPERGEPAPQRASDGHAVTARRRRVLFISADPIGHEMAGLGIRYWELARTLAAHADVTIAHGGTDRLDGDVRTILFDPHRPAALHPAIDDADVVVTHPQWPLVTRWLRRARARIVFDLYDPETLETLELLGGQPLPVRRQMTATTVDRLHDALRTGHHFMCASETQRDLWLGAMLALRLIDPATYDRDPGMRSIIDLVPFGVPELAPAPSAGPGPRERVPALGEDDEIVLWGGGVWRWLDAETAIRAVVDLARRRPSVRLVFMGASSRHPAARQSVEAARALARELGAFGSLVHFYDGWVPYAERAAWLLQADCALSCHRDHLETRFAFRTRTLDCFWGGLPVVCTEGDDLAEYVAREGLGAACPPADPQAVGVAVEQVLERGRDAYATALRAAASAHTWPNVARPLLRWVDGEPAPERPGDAPGIVRLPLAQRAREGAYRLGGRRLLARRARRRG